MVILKIDTIFDSELILFAGSCNNFKATLWYHTAKELKPISFPIAYSSYY